MGPLVIHLTLSHSKPCCGLWQCLTRGAWLMTWYEYTIFIRGCSITAICLLFDVVLLLTVQCLTRGCMVDDLKWMHHLYSWLLNHSHLFVIIWCFFLFFLLSIILFMLHFLRRRWWIMMAINGFYAVIDF